VFCRAALLLLLGTVAMQPPARPSPTSIEHRISGLLAAFPGTLGIAATNLMTGEEVAVNADTRFPTASTIKVAVMIEAYHQAAAGALPLDTTLSLRPEDKVGGSGVLDGMHAGLSITVRDLVYLMIVLSDNTATNLLVGRLGTIRINERLASYGLTETKLFRPTFRDGRADVHPELEREFGLGMTTPREMARLMALIANGKAVSRDASDQMLATLRRQQDRAMIPRLLPQVGGLQIGNKTGTDAEKQPAPDGTRRHVRGDAAIITGPGLRYVVTIFARQVEDTRPGVENDAVVMGARVSRVIYDHFSVAEK
jgi:beta-lactamase class A